MRNILLLACLAGGATASIAASFTDTVEIRPGFAEVWRSPIGFARVHVGDPSLIDVMPGNDQALIITAKTKGGTTNVLLMDGDGKQVANLLVRTPIPATWDLAQSARDGHLHVFWKGSLCFPNCEPLPPKPRASEQADAAPVQGQSASGAD